MHETEAELDELDALLAQSLSGSTAHLQSIIVPGERTLTSRQLVRLISGMCVLTLATVTAGGEPRVSAVDGHFLHGRWIFSTARSSAKARHLRQRPAASVAHLRGEELGVFTHGTAELLNPQDGPVEPDFSSTLSYLTDHYGTSPLDWGDVVVFRLQPSWMVVFAANPQELLGGKPETSSAG